MHPARQLQPAARLRSWATLVSQGLAAAGGREQTHAEDDRSHKDSSPFEETVRLDGNRRIDRRMAMRSSGPGSAFMGPEAECFRPSECPTSCAMVSPTRWPDARVASPGLERPAGL